MSDHGFNQRANGTATPHDARALAARLHEGQKDHSGRDYILHPERVKNNLLRIYPDAPDTVIMAAWLHDTIEDCFVNGKPVDEQYLRDHNIPEETIIMVTLLTKPVDDERSYEQVIDDLIASNNHGAMLVKLSDNMDNLHPARTTQAWIDEMDETAPGKAEALIDRYKKSVVKLSNALGVDPDTVFAAIQKSEPLKPEFRL